MDKIIQIIQLAALVSLLSVATTRGHLLYEVRQFFVSISRGYYERSPAQEYWIAAFCSRKLWHLLSCPFCVSFWFAVPIVFYLGTWSSYQTFFMLYGSVLLITQLLSTLFVWVLVEFDNHRGV